MMRLIDLAGYATPIMVLLMTREMILRVLDVLSLVTGAVFSIAVCLLPSLSLHLMLLPMSALPLWATLTGPFGTRVITKCQRIFGIGSPARGPWMKEWSLK
jgi:hypothetical protein